MVPHATFNTSFPLPSEDPSPLHGVLHSTSLPRILAGKYVLILASGSYDHELVASLPPKFIFCHPVFHKE